MFPSMDAFGGWGGLMGFHLQEPPPIAILSDLNFGYQRFPDTFAIDYASLLRDPKTGDDKGPLSDAVPPDPKFPGPRKVALIGGGIGNLISAYELARCGVVPVIYDDSSAVGGRLWTEVSSNGAIAEMGAMRVPRDSKLFWHYFSRYWGTVEPLDPDVELHPFPNPGVVPTHINWQDGLWQFCNAVSYKPYSKLPEIFKNLAADFTRRVREYTVRRDRETEVAFKDVRDILKKADPTAQDRDDVFRYWSTCLADFEKRSIGSVIADKWEQKDGHSVKWEVNEITAFEALGLGTGGFGPLLNVSFIEVLRWMLWDYRGEYALPPKASMSNFAQWFSDAIYKAVVEHHPQVKKDELFKLDRVVHDVIVRRVGLQLKVRVDTEGVSDLYDFAIVGMTTRAMQKLRLDQNAPGGDEEDCRPFSLGQPGQAPEQSKIIESVQSGLRRVNGVSASKTFDIVPKESLNSDQWPQYHYRNKSHPIQVTLTDKYPRASYWFRPAGEATVAAVLTSYTLGNDSVKLEAIPAYKRTSTFARALANLTNDSAQGPYGKVAGILDLHAGEAITFDWQSMPNFYCAFKLDQPGDYYYTSSLAFHYRIGHPAPGVWPIPAQLVYLNGDSCSFLGGWIEGAMMAGINAATAILSACGAQKLRSADLMTPKAMPFHTYVSIGGDPIPQLNTEPPSIEVTADVAS